MSKPVTNAQLMKREHSIFVNRRLVHICQRRENRTEMFELIFCASTLYELIFCLYYSLGSGDGWCWQ